MAILWMLASLFIISGLTAVITSALTVNELQTGIQDSSDLKRASVVSVQSSSSAEFLTEQCIQFLSVASLEDALKVLASGRSDAVVYDRPLLRVRSSRKVSRFFKRFTHSFSPSDVRDCT